MTFQTKTRVFLRRLVAFTLLGVGFATVNGAAAEPLRIIAFGDSLTAGYGLSEADAFPTRLQAALRARGHDVEIVNAGVSGDTTQDGLNRLDWSIDTDADAVIVELGGNDALRATDPAVSQRALDAILARLQERGLPVLLAGMKAPPNLGARFGESFDGMYPALAERYGTLFYPFFLDGVITRRELFQDDAIHPNAAGVDIIVEGILPVVEELIARAAAG